MFLTHRPRNVDSPRAAALLYGDLGTSKAYVIGLAFALAGYASFWLIAAVSLLTLLIGMNYIIICKYYPNGGGVYASVRHRSEMLSLIGAFFIIADYLVTAALSALSAFTYLGVSDPITYAATAIAIIGILNYFGPRHTGSIAFIIALFTFTILTLLVLFSLPYLSQAWHHLEAPTGNALTLWQNFVGVIVALSGIEAIANTTGVMKLDPTSTEAHPRVTRTAKKAIITVIVEVALYTAFFAFVVNAIDQFSFSNGNVDAPGNPNVRDYMLKYLGETFVGNLFGPELGHWFGVSVAISLGILLLSAVNTSLSALISLQYLMAHDQELPKSFRKINRFGVPLFPLFVATIIPLFLVIAIQDIASLAALYAIGFVGAIATNLGSTSTDKTLDLKKWERALMFFSFLIMAAVEVTIFIDKPEARLYALIIIFSGLLLKVISRKRKVAERLQLHPSSSSHLREEMKEVVLTHSPELYTLLCVVNKERSDALKSALKESAENNYPLHLLFIREQRVLGENDLERKWEGDQAASYLFTYASENSNPTLLYCHYCISDSPSDTIATYIGKLEVNHVILDKQIRGILLRKKMIREIRAALPENTLLISTI